MKEKNCQEDFFENDLHANRLKTLRCIADPMNKINEILSEKVKPKSIAKIQEYMVSAKAHKDKLLMKVESFLRNETILPDRKEDKISDIEVCVNFLSDYIRLLLIEYMIDCYTHLDFHIHADDATIAKAKQAENYVAAQEHKAKDTYAYLKKAKRHSDKYFNREYKEAYPKFNIRQYDENKNVDFINTTPYSPITNKDIENAYQILMKMVHWTIYANDGDTKLLRDVDLFSKKTSGGQDSTIEHIFNDFIKILYIPLYIANIPLLHSAKIIKTGFDYINQPFIEAYTKNFNKTAFTYETSTIEKKLKPIKAAFKTMNLEELILKK